MQDVLQKPLALEVHASLRAWDEGGHLKIGIASFPFAILLLSGLYLEPISERQSWHSVATVVNGRGRCSAFQGLG